MAASPKHRLAADALAGAIADGRLSTGDQLPPERVLAEEMGISRMTLRQAIRHLAERGVLEPRGGRGTFVRQPVIHQDLSALTGFTEEMARQGRRAGSVVVEAARRAPDPETAQALGLAPGAEVWRIARLRLADGEAVGLETTEVAADLAPDLLDRADLAGGSLYAALREHYGLRPALAEQTFAADAADAGSALSLGLARGAPVLRLTRLTRDAAGRPFERVRSVYRGDAFVMRVRLALPPAPE